MTEEEALRLKPGTILVCAGRYGMLAEFIEYATASALPGVPGDQPGQVRIKYLGLPSMPGWNSFRYEYVNLGFVNVADFNVVFQYE